MVMEAGAWLLRPEHDGRGLSIVVEAGACWWRSEHGGGGPSLRCKTYYLVARDTTAIWCCNHVHMLTNQIGMSDRNLAMGGRLTLSIVVEAE